MKISNNQINKLGERLRCSLLEKQRLQEKDLELLQQYRISYKEPLYVASQELHLIMNKVDKNGIITYRVKRIESIFSKLKRQKDMKLARMHDIAGARCILQNEKLVRLFLSEIQKSQILKIVDIDDYISNPKSTGYKSIHVTCACLDKKIEIQIRDENQHAWATLVEITDVIFHTKIKEKNNDNNTGLSEFFRIFSKSKNLSKEEHNRLNKILIENRYIQRLTKVFKRNVPRMKKEWCKLEERTVNFYLFSVNEKNKIKIKGFDDFTKAEEAYFNSFRQKTADNIVMAYIISNDFKVISKAYSNYILINHNFYTSLVNILQNDAGDSLINSDSLSLLRLCKACQIYINIKELGLLIKVKENYKSQEWDRNREIELKQLDKRENCNYKATPSSKEYEIYYFYSLINLFFMKKYDFFKRIINGIVKFVFE